METSAGVRVLIPSCKLLESGPDPREISDSLNACTLRSLQDYNYDQWKESVRRYSDPDSVPSNSTTYLHIRCISTQKYGICDLEYHMFVPNSEIDAPLRATIAAIHNHRISIANELELGFETTREILLFPDETRDDVHIAHPVSAHSCLQRILFEWNTWIQKRYLVKRGGDPNMPFDLALRNQHDCTQGDDHRVALPISFSHYCNFTVFIDKDGRRKNNNKRAKSE